MPNKIVTGDTTNVRQPTVVRFDPVRGVSLDVEYQSPFATHLNGLAQAFAALRWAYQFQSGGAVSRLQATASGAEAGQPEITTDNWQILANEIQKDIFECRNALLLEENVPGALIQVLRNYNMIIADSGKQLADAVWTKPTVASTDLTVSQYLLALLMRATTHFALSQYVLRHTTNVSQSYSANVSDSNVERIYTTAQLLAECQDSTLWAFPIPGRLAYKLNQIAAPTARTGYTWGWRKLASSETTTADNRIEITTEYWLEQWNTDTLYLTHP